MNRRIFLSMPITGIDRHIVLETNKLMKELALQMGMQPVSPIDIVPSSVFSDNSDDAWRQAMIITLPELLCCNSIMIAPKWEYSHGCIIEETIARLRDYNRIYLNLFKTLETLRLSYNAVIKSQKYENDFIQCSDKYQNDFIQCSDISNIPTVAKY